MHDIGGEESEKRCFASLLAVLACGIRCSACLQCECLLAVLACSASACMRDTGPVSGTSELCFLSPPLLIASDLSLRKGTSGGVKGLWDGGGRN